MEQLKCHICDGPLKDSDRFCHSCGAVPAGSQRPAPWPGTSGTATIVGQVANGDQQSVAGPARSADPFFGHGKFLRSGYMTNATRYLCAAAYLDGHFADDVIWELVASHRAIAPSIDIDVGPIMRHCLNSRRLRIVRDIVLSILVLSLFIIKPFSTLDFVLICLVLGVMLPKVRARRSNLIVKMFVTVCSVVILLALAGWLIDQILGSLLLPVLENASLSASLTGGVSLAGVLIFLAVAAWSVQYTFLRSWLHALAQDLQPGGSPVSGHEGAARNRIALAEAAQWGNVILHGGDDPFIGTGFHAGDWSIAIELDRARQARSTTTDGRPRGDVPIDPVELQRRIQSRMLKLNDPDLPLNERLSGLSVSGAVVGTGSLRWDNPLVDRANRAPYSMASPEAIDALIRHPQAALRYYLRVSICDQGPPVMANGRQVIVGVDQGIAVSMFVYVAVEGRMFYLQFIRKALPPVRRTFQLVDRMPLITSPRFRIALGWQAFTSMFGAVMSSPAGLYRAIRLSWRERKLDRDFSPSERLFADFGTQFSVREHGTAAEFGSYIRELDVDKYTRIIERLLLDTVIDFLEEKGVDISAFKASADTIINNVVNNAGTISGSNFQMGQNNTQMRGQAKDRS